MSVRTAILTGRERTFAADEIIVSKTDTTGRITYANDIFLQVSGYTEAEILGQPHNIVRHPEMPRCVFKLMWDTIAGGDEIFCYVNNRAKTGDNYWVFAHITPSYNAAGEMTGYHSNRRSPRREAVEKIRPIYARLLQTEKDNGDGKSGMAAASRLLTEILDREGLAYDEFVLAL